MPPPPLEPKPKPPMPIDMPWLTLLEATATVTTSIALAPASRAASNSCGSIARVGEIGKLVGTKTGVAPWAMTAPAIWSRQI